MKLHPFRDMVVCEIPQVPEETDGGILLTDNAREAMKGQEGVVKAIGPDVPLGVLEVGDMVLFTRYGGHMKDMQGGMEARILPFADIYAKRVDE